MFCVGVALTTVTASSPLEMDAESPPACDGICTELSLVLSLSRASLALSVLRESRVEGEGEGDRDTLLFSGIMLLACCVITPENVSAWLMLCPMASCDDITRFSTDFLIDMAMFRLSSSEEVIIIVQINSLLYLPLASYH